MINSRKFFAFFVLILFSVNLAFAHEALKSLAITMTNDPLQNSLKVYDTSTHALLQVIYTHGKGGVSGNAFGVKQYHNSILAVVNNGSNSVSIFKRKINQIFFEKTVSTLPMIKKMPG